jgi:hypothetical protein
VARAAVVYTQNSACAIALSFRSPAFMTSQFNSSFATLLSPLSVRRRSNIHRWSPCSCPLAQRSS